MTDTGKLLGKISALVDGYTGPDATVSPDAMRAAPDPVPADDISDLFGEVIHTYTRAEAIADGYLVEADPGMARQAGLGAPVALTRAAWEDCVAWTEEDTRRQGTVQDADGRLWDVLWMAAAGIRRATTAASATRFPLMRVPRGGRARAPRKVWLEVTAGPGDAGELVLTISLPGED